MRRLAVLVVIPFLVVACGSDSKSSDPPPATAPAGSPNGVDLGLPGEPQGTLTFSGLARNHVDTPIQYPQTPPVGGNHNPVWQNCQYYDTAIPNERAVHDLEHGAVWITYAPETSQADRDVLKALADTGDHIIVSQYAGLPSPIVATAWGKQLQLPSVNDPRLKQFVQAFENGPQTPEPGATCRQSTSDTTPVG
ncbi:MAG TPA: DUF3105 domain-containing protein [Ilumatobacteraceae bacterium]